jgi:hypothetical protein
MGFLPLTSFERLPCAGLPDLADCARLRVQVTASILAVENL